MEGDHLVKDRSPTPAWVEIQLSDGGFVLLHMDADGVCLADTWHETLVEAKAQAQFEFGIQDEDWRPAEPDDGDGRA
jgi:hypothetical protein